MSHLLPLQSLVFLLLGLSTLAAGEAPKAQVDLLDFQSEPQRRATTPHTKSPRVAKNATSARIHSPRSTRMSPRQRKQ